MEQRIRLQVTDGVCQMLVDQTCQDRSYGARPLRRAIENYVEDPLSEELLKGEFHSQIFLTLAVLGALIGSVSFSGSLIAFAKLQGIMDTPVNQPFWPGRYEPLRIDPENAMQGRGTADDE